MAVEQVDHLAILVVTIRRFLGMGAMRSRSLRFDIYDRMQRFFRRSTFVRFRRFLGDVRREFLQGLTTNLHGTLGSYLGDALQEGSADVVAYLPVPRALACGVFSSSFFFAWWFSLLFLVRNLDTRKEKKHIILLSKPVRAAVQ
jgi:hypothetical protein